MRVLAMCTLLFAMVLWGCSAAQDGAGEGKSTPGSSAASECSFWCKAACDPVEALLGLRAKYPAARYFIEKAVPGVFSGADLPELKFDSREELRSGLEAPHGATVAVFCVIERREVTVRVTQRMIDAKPGPYRWHLKGVPRESATSFVDGVMALHEAAGAQTPTWYIHFTPMEADAATALCRRLEVTRLDVFDVSSSGRMTPRGMAGVDDLGKIARPALARHSFGEGKLDLSFIPDVTEIMVSIETPRVAQFESLAAKVEEERR